MKLMKRTQIYKGSNVTLDPNKVEARSYQHWAFVQVIDDKVIFNNYFYSNTTRRHQRKVFAKLAELNIKIDFILDNPKSLDHFKNLNDLFLDTEEFYCDRFLTLELKRQDRNAANRYKAMKKRVESLLENQYNFRDYIILPMSRFGSVNKIGVHQKIDKKSIEHDIENALHNFCRDGFSEVFLYVEV